MANDYRYPGIIDVAVNYDDIDLNVVSIPGEGGSPIYTLTRCEAALLVARAFVTYGSIALYCFTYTTLRFGSSCLTQDNAASTDVVYLVHGIMLFTMIAAAFTICVDLRFLWIVRRHRSRQALDQRVVELFPSPLFILYYAYTRGDGFGANSREPAMLHIGLYSIICDLPIALILSIVLTSFEVGFPSITWAAFAIAMWNTSSGCFVIPCAFADPPKDQDDDLDRLEGDAGDKLDERQIQLIRAMRMRAREILIDKENRQARRHRGTAARQP
ncbi:Uncharacterized protein PBTT_07546 [Plasmodiophora brassicae]|uniref:Uncharacterized protein n=1 Tax=Plasmodiophora brassicae TaxID=37360 RepID=A0A0G4IMK1_PLABS|nr:hypothetical protein PBRA_004998 [Plasmodiophora brassicae]SPQ99266.1 unnamed protein product [Plasmodiophora brassicae]